MRRFLLLRNLTLQARDVLRPSPNPINLKTIHIPTPSPAASAASSLWRRRFCSDSSSQNPDNAGPPAGDSPPPLIQTQKEDSVEIKDVSNEDLKKMMKKYFSQEEKNLPEILEAIFHRKMSGKHEESDHEWLDELQGELLSFDVPPEEEIESDFDDLHETDEEIDDLYNAKEYAMKKIVKDEYFNMDDSKWDQMIKEAMDQGFIKDTRECEEMLEDMLCWDKLLPDDMKQKVKTRYNELGDRIERGEIEPQEAYELFTKFEDEMVLEYQQRMEAEGPPQFDETEVPDQKKDIDDPPGEGPILRWQTRVVFAPGGDAWHPKNRKVKLSVTVKELGLSKHQFRRLRELTGKRYHPGRDELTITSERFEHREENRKDCLRTLLLLIEEAGKARKLVEDARVLYVKDRLRANPAFMDRLRAKIMRQGSKTVSAREFN